ncbi:MAG: hypothetical protein EOP52_11150 [Sphingobacteriales bacterium]|nr:MAG: hypothetical protein EOP52_11150 [Sphingobacteriales bacterium]
MNWISFFKLFSILSLLATTATAQEPLVKDLDTDGRADTVRIDPDRTVIVCLLSSKQFRKLESQPIETLTEQSGIKATRNGFEFYNNFMRAGYGAQFRYQPATQKVQLIGLSRYEFGNAANDGSGESSVNLLTGDYIGNWNYYDFNAKDGDGALIQIPPIKTRMPFQVSNFEAFGEATYEAFATRCYRLYEHAKKRMQSKKK